MGFLGYLLLGAAVYVAGFSIYSKRLKPSRPKGVSYDLKTPIIQKYLLGCFGIMLVLSSVLSLFVLGHQGIDVLYVLVNSLVATVVFYFGLNPDETNMPIPK